MPTPRERMVISAALLIRERGAQPTAIADVLEHSGAPRGSAYHYFPGGRTQLLCEAIDYTGEYVATKIAKADNGLDVLDGLVAYYRKQLLHSDYRAGCPVVAVTVEAGDPAKQDQTTPVIDRAAAAFTRWTDLIAQRLVADGVSATRAGELYVATDSGKGDTDVEVLDLTRDRTMRGVLRAPGAYRGLVQGLD